MRRVATMVIALMLLTVLLPSAAAAAPPLNDNLVDAVVLSGMSGSVISDNSEATVQDGELLGSAGDIHNSVWFQWNPGRKDLVATFSTCDGANFDTILQAYTSTSTPPTVATLNEVAIGDDNCGLQSTVQFVAKGGVTYWVRLAGYDTTSYGPFTLTWSTAAPVRASLSVTITTLRQDPNYCLFTLQGTNLEPGQGVLLKKGTYYGPYFTTEGGRWTPEPIAYDRSTWSVSAPGDIYMAYPVYATDGVTPVIAKITNRCK